MFDAFDIVGADVADHVTAETDDRTGRTAVYKPLHGGPSSEAGQHVALWARTVTAGDISDAVRRTAHLFQARVPGAAVRMTVVGETEKRDKLGGDLYSGSQDAASCPT